MLMAEKCSHYRLDLLLLRLRLLQAPVSLSPLLLCTLKKNNIRE